MSKQLINHYRQAIIGTPDQSKGKRKYWWQIILFSFAFILQEKKMI